MRLAGVVLLICLYAIAARADFDAAVLAYDSGRYDIAFDEFGLLSGRGDARAEFMLGAMYFYGRGVLQNDGFAAVWFHKAATQGHPGAQLAYGSLHIRGVGVTQNLIRAYMWLSLAADSKIPGLRQQAL